MNNMDDLNDVTDLAQWAGLDDTTDPLWSDEQDVEAFLLSDEQDMEAYTIPDGQEEETFLPPDNRKPSRSPASAGKGRNCAGKSGKPSGASRNGAVIAMLCFVLALLLGLIALVVCTKFYVLTGGRLYPRNVRELDLRDEEITPERYEALSRSLPECHILWNVPFQGGAVSSDTRELTVTKLSEEDLAALENLPELEVLRAEACTDYPQLAAFRQARPDCRVLSRVKIGEKSYDQDTQTVTLTTLTEEEAELLEYLPELETVEASACTQYGLLARLQQTHPQWDVRYTVTLGDSRLEPTAREAEVTGADSGELIAGLPGLPQLCKLTVTDPKADGATLLALRAQYPELELNWYFLVGGTVVPETAKEVDVSGMDFSSLEEAETMASCFPQLQTFVMSDCTVEGKKIDNEQMAEFRERARGEYKVVWTVDCGRIRVRTDATTFMPTREGEYYFQDEMCANLRYCEDMICVDVGHHRVKDISFVRYMPHLKYLILTDTAVQDISPLEDAKELIFLELTFGIVRDYTPLLGCTALEDLNMDQLWYYADPTPLYEMTWLKTLFWQKCSSRVAVKLQEALPDTRLDFTGTTTNAIGTGWRNLQNYYDMRDVLGMYYMN